MSRWRVLSPTILALFASGCVYYNGIYNAKSAAHTGDDRLRHGSDTEAAAFFQVSAAKAETVLVRHGKSSWRPYALYLAGRGAALGGQCELGTSRLTEYLALPGTPAADRDRARVALSACEVRSAKFASARARLDSLIDSRDQETAHQARLWAARAALAMGDRDQVSRYLGGADDAVIPWELLRSSLSAREYVRAESLLVARAERSDYRDDVAGALRELWTAGEYTAVESVIRRYDLSRVRDQNRAAMHFAVGDLNLRAGRDTVARQHLMAARTYAGRDTVLDRDAAARLMVMSFVRVPTLRDIDTVIAAQESGVMRTAYARRVNEQLLLVRLLEQQNEPTGASLFLAAEVARDSLGAIPLARSLFLRLVREQPQAPLAPQALHAAGVLWPDSAAIWNTRIRTEFPNSAVAAFLTGADPASRPDFATTPALLQARWLETLRVWSDSVRKLRAAPRPTITPADRN